MVVTFPHQALHQDTAFTLVGRSASGGVGLSGAMTRVASGSGHWKAQATFLIQGDDAHLAWLGFVSQMQGVLGETLLPAYPRILPVDIKGRTLSRKEAVGIDHRGLFDNTGLGQLDIKYAELSSDATFRDGFINVKYNDTTGIRVGHKIGLGDRLHEVLSTIDNGDGTHKVFVSPLLRSKYLAGERVIIDRPLCRVRFETDGEGIIPHNTTNAQSVTVNFREVF